MSEEVPVAHSPGADGRAVTRTSHVLIKNSVANVITGLSTALLALALPPVLARNLPPAEFGTWALILQVAGYTALLNLGMQGAVSRYVSYYLARDDRHSADAFVSTAFVMLCAAALVAAIAVVVAVGLLGRLFPHIPPTLLGPAQLSLCMVGVVLALGLPVTVFNGVFAGLQRNEIIAVILGSTRLILTLLLALGALVRHTLVPLAIIYTIVNLVSYGVTWAWYRRMAPARMALSTASGPALKEIWHYCGSVMIWSVAMLLISGADTAIVGRVDFQRVAAYSACVGCVAVLAGFQQALFSPLLQVGAAHYATGNTADLDRMLIRATRLGTLILLAPVAVLILFAPDILRIWLGATYAQQATLVFPLLMIGHAMRLIAMPYATLLLATTQHTRVIIAPVMEGLTNVIVAVLAGERFGASGVACGVIAGAVVGQAMNYFYNLPRTHPRRELRGELLRRSIIVPTACFLPAAVGIAAQWNGMLGAQSIILRSVLLLAALALAWGIAVEPHEKELLLRYFRRSTPR